MILLSRKKQIEILKAFKPITGERNALDILQEQFNMSFFELILYVRNTKEYAAFLKKNTKYQDSKYCHDDKVTGVREIIMDMYNEQFSILKIANAVKLDKNSVTRHITILRKAGLVGPNKRLKGVQ